MRVFRLSQINPSQPFQHSLARFTPRSRDARQQKPQNFSKSGNLSPGAYTSATGNKKPLGEREPRRRGVGTCCFRFAAGAKEGVTERMKGCEKEGGRYIRGGDPSLCAALPVPLLYLPDSRHHWRSMYQGLPHSFVYFPSTRQIFPYFWKDLLYMPSQKGITRRLARSFATRCIDFWNCFFRDALCNLAGSASFCARILVWSRSFMRLTKYACFRSRLLTMQK